MSDAVERQSVGVARERENKWQMGPPQTLTLTTLHYFGGVKGPLRVFQLLVLIL